MNVQGQVNERILIDTTFEYSNYFNKIVPIIGKAFQTVVSMGFKVNLISFNNGVFVDDKSDDIAEIVYTQKELYFGNDFFKKCMLFHFEKSEYYEDFKKEWVSNWKSFCTTLPQDGDILLVAINMDDTLTTKQYLKDFLIKFEDESEKLPKQFTQPFDIIDFVYRITLSEKKTNTKQYFSPTFQRVSFIRKPVQFINDPMCPDSSFKNVEYMELSGRTRTGYYFELLIYNSDIGFIIPGYPYPNKIRETEVIEEKQIQFSDSFYKRMKIKTTLSPETTILGYTYHTSPAVYGYDYITILQRGEFIYQISSCYPDHNRTPEIQYSQSDIEYLFNLIINSTDNE